MSTGCANFWSWCWCCRNLEVPGCFPKAFICLTHSMTLGYENKHWGKSKTRAINNIPPIKKWALFPLLLNLGLSVTVWPIEYSESNAMPVQSHSLRKNGHLCLCLRFLSHHIKKSDYSAIKTMWRGSKTTWSGREAQGSPKFPTSPPRCQWVRWLGLFR